MAASGGGGGGVAARRRFCGAAKQITKSNLAAALGEIESRVRGCDFVAVASRRTGDSSSSSSGAGDRRRWRRVLGADTAETAYLKAKRAAESFELLQLAVCPFRLRGSKVLAFPYNFHLFPRDELNMGMPSYSFSCQTSFLTSMAREGFDFNLCVYDGLSYLSRVQESMSRERIPIPHVGRLSSSSSPPSTRSSVADSIFMGRVKSRVEHWRKAAKEPSNAAEGSLVKSLRKLILGGDEYGSRPCLIIDVCSDHQVQLALEAVSHISDELVPIVVPEKGGEPTAVRVVLTSSEDDKNLLMAEIQKMEDEQNLKVRGFREVIDLISSSQKPIISYNCMHDFTFIHSKFLGPLPPTEHEFMCSLRMAFNNVIDVGHLLKEIGPLRRAKNIPSALSYLKRRFFVPVDLEIPFGDENGEKSDGHDVLRLVRLFAKLNHLLKITPDCQTQPGDQSTQIEDYSNVFYPTYTSVQEHEDEENIGVGVNTNVRKVSTENLVFLWGFGETSANDLKHRLKGYHVLFSEEFELRLADNTCAVVVFFRPGAAEELLREIGSGSASAENMASEGLKAAGFEAYKKVCILGLWDADLADSLESVLAEPTSDHAAVPAEVLWSGELMLDINDLLES
ncbi:poly(A)-specific ribonuclease PARN-like isoform X1 [Ananas comosus]|uniref:Poly(A)-specific ribonuclease PARN-like isoform X1 n=1 Tax=Ananas comosus TaxID=4615 RepID=A0A6P5GQZ6_ANACO|nr:poly(A)-specific ribonuclease PARN-like isoform X1 [Ananas comosus]XP_020110319.1 poly(A)-specific ribonuclease PARN-like isoform X1 [Ananas comosus]XP_020110320.1 poly(A)-specific ribonuclease PARN-like isoform X1 [Ananas comosus]